MRYLLLVLGLLISIATVAMPVPEGCSYTSQVCVENGGTRTIDGVPVTLDCWKYTQVYTCTQSPAVDTCGSMAKDKCNLQGQDCLANIAGLCVEYNYHFSCPTEKCNKKPLVCGKPAFCMDGNCFAPDVQKQPKDQLGKAAAEMAAAQAAADNTKKNADGTITIFQGDRLGCSVAIAGSNNCCTNGGGWNPIGSCSEDEHQLAKDKQKQLNIDNGSFCKNKVLGVCTSEEHPSCIYPSLIVKDIVLQGVIGQLYHGSVSAFYGGSENTNCRGITPEDLQKIDFDKVDFSNIEADMKKHMNMPDSGKSDKNANDKAACILDGTCKNQPDQEKQHNCLIDGTCKAQ